MITVLGLLMMFPVAFSCPIGWMVRFDPYWQTFWIVAGVVLIAAVNWP